jgi:hypothetical protein
VFVGPAQSQNINQIHAGQRGPKWRQALR